VACLTQRSMSASEDFLKSTKFISRLSYLLMLTALAISPVSYEVVDALITFFPS
jgi:hypothetical protein